MKFLKFITAGNVDDGKSTLIGRLLYDSKAISNDILASIQKSDEEVNLAYLTDGLRAEREQGITIDVAYKYFSTDKRKFVIADCPGHKEYTKNMITGASQCDLAIILIDAKRGITEQTKRHTFITDLMNIPCIVFCINKMDAINYDEIVFNQLKSELQQLPLINKHQTEFIPVSALKGDNIVTRSDKMNWYNGHTLIYFLENYEVAGENAQTPAFMQVQYVSFDEKEINAKRFYYGTILNDKIKSGDSITIYPTEKTNTIEGIYLSGKKVLEANHEQTIAITLKEDTEVQRGYFLTTNHSTIDVSIQKNSAQKEFSAICFWFDDVAFNSGKRYLIQHHAFRTFLKCKEVSELLNLDILQFEATNSTSIVMNDIFKAKFSTAQPLLINKYNECSALGSFIIIDESTHKTAGAGIVI